MTTQTDRRQHPRVDTQLKIRAVPMSAQDASAVEESLCIPSEEDLARHPGVVYTASLDLSEGGIRAVGSLHEEGALPAKGEHYLVEFQMPPGGRRALIHAVVMWSTPTGKSEALVGMKFETSSPRDLERIREYIQQTGE